MAFFSECVAYVQRAGLQDVDLMDSGTVRTALWLARLRFPLTATSHMPEKVPDTLPGLVGPGSGPKWKIDQLPSITGDR